MVRKNKKGSGLDFIMVASMLLVFAVVTLIGFKISDEINTQFQASDEINANGKEAFNKINNIFPTTIDNSFLLLALGLCLVALFLAAMVRFHPIFFVFYIILLVIIIFLCGIFSNIYLEIANSTDLVSVADRLTYITHIMHLLPFLVGIFGFILAIVMYRNWREAQ